MVSEEEVRKNVLEVILAVSPDIDLSNIKSDQTLRSQFDLDSMDFLDIVMELRKRYKIEVPKEEYRELATLDSAVKYLLPKFDKSVVSR